MTIYEIIRLIIPLTLVVAFIIIMYQKKNIKFSILLIIAFILFILLHIAVMNIPFENIFYSFNSPQSAFNYKHDEEIIDIIEYDDYSLILADKAGGATQGIHMYVLPKTNKGWKLDSNFSQHTKIVVSGFCMIKVIYITQENDCLLFISGYVDDLSIESLSSTTDNISDNRGTVFQQLSYPDMRTIYFAHIENIDKNYRLYIDDTEIEIDVD